MSISGTFYAAGARLNISGNGTTTVGSQYITNDLTTTGERHHRCPLEQCQRRRGARYSAGGMTRPPALYGDFELDGEGIGG